MTRIKELQDVLTEEAPNVLADLGYAKGHESVWEAHRKEFDELVNEAHLGIPINWFITGTSITFVGNKAYVKVPLAGPDEPIKATVVGIVKPF